MNDHSNDNHEPDTLSRAALIRCAADNELTDAQRARLDAHLANEPGDQARIEFDCELGRCCARALEAEHVPETPAALRERVAGFLAGRREIEADTEAETEPVLASISGEGVRHADGSARTSIERMIRPLMGLAAAIALVALATLFLRGALVGSTSFTQAQASELTNFVEKEHGRCATDLAESKFEVDPASMPGGWAEVVGTALSLDAMEAAGYHYVGAGECHVPGPGGSVHLLFESTNPAQQTAKGPMRLSLFLQKVPDERRGLEEGKAYVLRERCSRGGPIVMWVRDGLLYSLVSECPVACSSVRTALQAPAQDDTSLMCTPAQ